MHAPQAQLLPATALNTTQSSTALLYGATPTYTNTSPVALPPSAYSSPQPSAGTHTGHYPGSAMQALQQPAVMAAQRQQQYGAVTGVPPGAAPPPPPQSLPALRAAALPHHILAVQAAAAGDEAAGTLMDVRCVGVVCGHVNSRGDATRMR